MQSPPAEWALGIGHLIVLDWVRDRGEPDNDTLSEVLRAIYRVEHPHGRIALAASITSGAIGLYLHLTKRDMRTHHLKPQEAPPWR